MVLVLALVMFLGLRILVLSRKPAQIQYGLNKTKVPKADISIRGSYLLRNTF